MSPGGQMSLAAKRQRPNGSGQTAAAKRQRPKGRVRQTHYHIEECNLRIITSLYLLVSAFFKIDLKLKFKASLPSCPVFVAVFISSLCVGRERSCSSPSA
uniref:Histone H2A/H2B/H3 domain-containing protein n=1 Tax=Trichuris muris TaxID=70415 RepID=A0A5S6Q7B6_TRIMR